jgi:hypothetical protein
LFIMGYQCSPSQLKKGCPPLFPTVGAPLFFK